MPNRASLFSPFDALTGLKELLSECEKIKETPPILSPDQIEEMNNQLNTLKEKDRVSITFFHKKRENITGKIKKI
ncbi:MAG: YolD-like family protein, partial [Bacilli bacterium]|nr:YolD-like family protein [Bacilli bacterium]